MHAQDFVGRGVGQKLDEAGGITQCAGAAIGQKRERARLVRHAVRLELLLGASHPGNLRAGVNHPGNGIEVDMSMLTGNALGHGNALFFCLVRQHGATHHVAHRPDVGQVGLAVAVHFDSATLVELEVDRIGSQTYGVGHATNRHDQLVHVQRLGFTLGIGVSH